MIWLTDLQAFGRVRLRQDFLLNELAEGRHHLKPDSEVPGFVPPFTMYDLRHTCLTRWAAHMDPYTLAYLAGHSDFSTTRRYVHPQTETIRAALERVRAQVETPAKKVS